MNIYEEYEREAKPYKAKAICRPGCSFCCTGFGNIDMVTLEGEIIRRYINECKKPERNKFRKQIDKNKKDKEKGVFTRCPFLNEADMCRIYEVRPFICRSLYSVSDCRQEKGPTLHREAKALADKTIIKIQALDDTGYSGHISYILYLLNKDSFRKTYLTGGFDPQGILSFGKSHHIAINRFTGK